MFTLSYLSLFFYFRMLRSFVRLNPSKYSTQAFNDQLVISQFAAKNIDELITYIQTVHLPKQFGFKDFRPGQKEVIVNLLSNKSCLAVLPTGAGKSLCFQLPAQILNGVTVVVSPLLALMRDQVDSLHSKGISACRIDSSMNFDEIAATEEKLRKGHVKLIYVSPERFSNERFMKILEKTFISLLVVDEAHCISEWGHSFRPDYLRLYEHSKKLNVNLFLALTATATSRVTQDIIRNLGIPADNVVKQPSYRMNLKLETVKLGWPNDNYVDRLLILKKYLSKLKRDKKFGPTIVYVSRQKVAVQLAQDLECSSYNARAYHGGMTSDARQDVEDWYLGSSSGSSRLQMTDSNDDLISSDDTSSNDNDYAKIVVATSAFGMGIDKANIRSVIHWELPRSIEDYIQGIGRSGRDGAEAHCLAMVGDVDITLLQNSIQGSTPPQQALREFIAYILDKNTGFKVLLDQNVLYVNLYEVANLFDINESSLKLGLSYLCQQSILKEKTTVFGIMKVSKIDEVIFQQFVATTSTTAAALLDELDSYRRPDEEKDLKDLSVAIAQYVIELSRKSPRKKWLEIDTLQVANDLLQLPQRVMQALNLLIDHNVCTMGGVSKPNLRYSYNYENTQTEGLLMSNVSDQVYIEELLTDYFQKNEVRSLARLFEVHGLLSAPSMARDAETASASLWDKVIKYFDSDEINGSNCATSSGEGGGPAAGKEAAPAAIPFEESDWSDLITALTATTEKEKEKDSISSLLFSDTYCMTNFITGVLSPKIFRLKLYQHPSFGSLAHWNWREVYTSGNMNTTKKGYSTGTTMARGRLPGYTPSYVECVLKRLPTALTD